MGIIRDSNWNKVGEVDGNIIRDSNWNKVGEIDGTIIRDSNWNKIGEVEGGLHTAVGGAALLLLL